MTEPARVIPYGTARPPSKWMPRSSAEDGFAIRVPCVTVSEAPDGALRLDSWLGGSRATPKPESPGDDQLASLCRALTRHCDPWRRSERQFLACYFDFVGRHVERNRVALIGNLEPFAGLFRYSDWVYSALMPLPRAHLHAPDSGEPFGPDTLIRVDFAFWTGMMAIAIELPGTGTRSLVTNQRHERLRRAGTRIIELADEVLDPAHAAKFEAALPDELRQFWRDRALPSGPLKSAALDVEADEIQISTSISRT